MAIDSNVNKDLIQKKILKIFSEISVNSEVVRTTFYELVLR